MRYTERLAIGASIDMSNKARKELWGIPNWGQKLIKWLWGVDIQEARCDCFYAAHHLQTLIEE